MGVEGVGEPRQKGPEAQEWAWRSPGVRMEPEEVQESEEGAEDEELAPHAAAHPPA